MPRPATILVVTLFIIGPLCCESRGQLPQIRLDRIFPLGGKPVSEVAIEVAGRDMDEARSLVFDHPGLKAKFVEANKFKVAIATGTPPGIYEVRAIGKYGLSGSRLFAVTADLAVAREAEPNDAPEKAQGVAINSVIDGESDEGGDDFYRVEARRGQHFLVEVQALRLDSPMRAAAAIRSQKGKELARGAPHYRQTDPLIDFVAPDDGAYVVQVRDVTYAGGYPYRLVISDRPYLECVTPTAARPGTTANVIARGRNLGAGGPQGSRPPAEPRLETRALTVRAPCSPDAVRLAMIDDLASPILNGRVFQAWPEGLEHGLNPPTMTLARASIVAEAEPNDSPESAQKLSTSVVVSGGFDRPNDVDWYEITGKANEPIAVELLAERIGAPCDARVVVLDAKGNEVATFDDHGIDIRALSQSNRDPIGVFTPGEAGTYRLVVEETYRRGGPRLVYALRVGKPEPDFAPVAFHESQPDPTCPLVRRGGSTLIEICLNRRDGFDQAVTIEAEGLPRGVSGPTVYVGPQSEAAAVVFTASADAPDWAGPIRLRARAKIGERAIEHPVQGVQRRWGTVNSPAARACREVGLAVRSESPYGLQVPSGPIRVVAGGSADVRVEARRGKNASSAPIQVTLWEPPPGFEAPATALPAGSKAASLTLKVSPDVPPGRFTLVFRGEIQVAPSEGAGPVRVNDPATPLTVEVLPKKP
jgi:hypothetical protein